MPIASQETAAEKKEEELNACQKAVNFFLDPKTRWEFEYLGLNREEWFSFLQSRFPDENGRWFDFDLFSPEEFLTNISRRIQAERQEIREERIPTPSIPPQLKELVDVWETEKQKKKKIEKEINQKLADARKAMRHYWEIAKYDELIRTGIKPQIKALQEEVAKQTTAFASKYPQLAETTQIFSQVVSKITSKLSAEELNAIIKNNELKKEILEPAIVRTLELKGGLADKDYEKVFGMPKEVAEALGAGRKLKEIADKVAENLSANSEIIQNSKNQAFFIRLQEALEKRKEYLEKKADDSTYQPEEKEQEAGSYLQYAALSQLESFISQTLEDINLQKELNLTDKEMKQIAQGVFSSVASQTFLSRNPILSGQSSQQLDQILQAALQKALVIHIKKSGRIGAFSSLKMSLGLQKQKAEKVRRIFAQISKKTGELPPQLKASVQAAALLNYGSADQSIEAGNPLGKLPPYVLHDISILPDTLDKLRPEFRKIFDGHPDPVLAMDPKDFVNSFQEYWKLLYRPDKDFSSSQRTAIARYVQFLQEFYKKNPLGFRLFRWYQKHSIGISWGKEVGKFIIQHPDYLLQTPWIFGKAWLRNKKALKWELIWKPKIFDFVINKVPVFGKIFGFFYQKNAWGVYESLWTRAKKKVQKWILQKGIKGTGKLVWKIGKKLGIKFLAKLGVKIFASGMTGGVAALFFAFYPLFKKTLKKIAVAFAALWLVLLQWALTYGTGALIGFGLGTLGGIAAGIKVGALTFGALPFLGPLAIIPAFVAGGLTFLACSAIGTGLGIFFTKIWLGIKGAFSSLLAPGAAGLGGGITAVSLSSYAFIAPATLAGIGALTATTIFITSSAFVIPSEGETYGSKYIQIQKGFDIDGQAQHQFEFENNEVLGKNLNYGINVAIAGKQLTDVVVNDKIEIISKTTTVYQEKTWNKENRPELAEMNPGKSIGFNYTIVPDESFKNAYINNTVTVTSKEGEKQTLTLTITVGQPPVPASVRLAIKIVHKLSACPGLKKENGTTVNASTWPRAKKCLEEDSIPPFVINVFQQCVNQRYQPNGELQCVSFVVGATMGDLPHKGAARDYCTQNTAGYLLRTDWDNIKEGDIIASSRGYAGHVALAINRIENSQGNLLQIRVAEAIGSENYGVVQYRNIPKEVLVSHYCGYLRKQ